MAQQLTSGREQPDLSQRNVKEMLLNLLRDEGGGRAGQLANQALQNLTGQQLLSDRINRGICNQ